MTDPDRMVVINEGVGCISFAVHVQPRASKCSIAGIMNGAIKIRLTSPPVDGAANEQCTNFIADVLNIRRRNVMIISGETSRSKILKVIGVTTEQLQTTLYPYIK